MGQTDLDRAIEFVRQRGTVTDRARLDHILYGRPAPEEIREQFERSQRGDGGWAAFWAPDYSSLDATCYQLALADQIGIDRKALMIIDAVRFLAERQHSDGSWEEDPAQAEAAPLWAQPGSDAARLYITANCGFWASATGLIPSAAGDAATFLRFHLKEDGSLPSFPHAHWLAAALWHAQGMSYETDKCLTYLRGRVAHLSAGNLAWMVLALRKGGVPAKHETVAAALDRLGALRDPAGHWPADEDADNAPHVTIEAVRALQLGGRLS